MAGEEELDETSRVHPQHRPTGQSTSKQAGQFEQTGERQAEQAAGTKQGDGSGSRRENEGRGKEAHTDKVPRGSGSGSKLDEEAKEQSGFRFADFIDDLAKGLQERTDTVFAEFGEFQRMSGKRFPLFEKVAGLAHREMIEEIDVYADKLERYSYNLFLGGRTEETSDIIEDYLQGKRTRLAFCDNIDGVDIDTIKNSLNQQLELLQENKQKKVLEKYEGHLSAVGLQMKETLLEKIQKGKVEDMDDLVLYLDRKNIENTEFMFNYQCSVDHLKARINKL